MTNQVDDGTNQGRIKTVIERIRSMMGQIWSVKVGDGTSQVGDGRVMTNLVGHDGINKVGHGTNQDESGR